MNETIRITDLVAIGDRVTTILAEVRSETDLHLRATYSTSDAGAQSERYVAIVRAGPGHWRHFDIAKRDFKFLRWAGVRVEVIGGPAAARVLRAPEAASPGSPRVVAVT